MILRSPIPPVRGADQPDRDGLFVRPFLPASSGINSRQPTIAPKIGPAAPRVGPPAPKQFTAIVASDTRATIQEPSGNGRFEEILVPSGGEFPATVCLLDHHTAGILGDATEFRLSGNRWFATATLTNGSARAESKWRQILAGSIDCVSLGYHVSEFTRLAPGQSQRIGGVLYQASDMPLRVSTRWQAVEVSIVTDGADPTARITSARDPSKPIRQRLRPIVASSTRFRRSFR